jgi:hypothetical protein
VSPIHVPMLMMLDSMFDSTVASSSRDHGSRVGDDAAGR